jgi:hypothetical protein
MTGKTRKAARAAKATDTSRGCFSSHASNCLLFFISASGASQPFGRQHGLWFKIRQGIVALLQSLELVSKS